MELLVNSIICIFNFKAILLKSDLLYLLTYGVDVFTFLQEFIILRYITKYLICKMIYNTMFTAQQKRLENFSKNDRSQAEENTINYAVINSTKRQNEFAYSMSLSIKFSSTTHLQHLRILLDTFHRHVLAVQNRLCTSTLFINFGIFYCLPSHKRKPLLCA